MGIVSEHESVSIYSKIDQNPFLFTKSPKIDWTSVLGSAFLESPNIPQFDVTQKPYQFP